MSETIIVGAGLVGALLSILLAKSGRSVEVFDRTPDTRKTSLNSGRSINLTLCERGLNVLDSVGVGDAVRAASVPVYGRLIHDIKGGLTFQPYGNHGEAIYSIARNELNEILLDFAERNFDVRFKFGEKCVGVDLDAPAVEMRNLATGKTTRHAAGRVFGSDGAYSAVRLQMQKKMRLCYSQQYCEQGYKELGVPPSTEGWAAEKNVIHIWPRRSYMLIGFPNTDGSFTCSLHIPFEGPLSFASIRSERDLLGLFRDSFPDAVSFLPRLVDDFFHHPANSMVTIKCSPWSYRDKVVLIGDAAHSIFPSYGQGANAGFEDCATLYKCLSKHGDNWAAILEEYESQRRPNTDAIADLCVQHFIELRDLVGDPGFLLRKEIERKLNLCYPEKYRDLYSMITFTCMPYTEALCVDREQRVIVDRILGVEEIEQRLDSEEVSRVMDELMAAR
jgi:kynurenine 3-monooxygenase